MRIETREFYEKLIFLSKRMELCQGEELFRLSTEREVLVFGWQFKDDQASLTKYVKVFCENRTKAVCEGLDISKYLGMNPEELRKEAEAIGIKDAGVHEQICRDIAITWNWHNWNNRALADGEETMMGASHYHYNLHLRSDLSCYEHAKLQRESNREAIPRVTFIIFVYAILPLISLEVFQRLFQDIETSAALVTGQLILTALTIKKMLVYMFGRYDGG